MMIDVDETGTTSDNGNGRKTVLVVEDSRTIRHVLRVLLEGEGYDVITAADGAQGLDLARRLRPHVVTLDLALPDLDGRDVLRQLKSDEMTRRIPVVVISAYAAALTPGERWYADEVMAKPFDVEDLLACLQRAIKRYDGEDAA